MSDEVRWLLERGRELQGQIATRQDDAPNLRDYGFERRPEYEAAIAAYHQETSQIEAEYQRVGKQRIELQASQR